MTSISSMNGHAVGACMKEMVVRAIEEIRAQRFICERTVKQGHDGAMDDLVTSADKAAQGIYVRLIHERFPGFGIIAEEAELSEPCTLDGPEMYFTVDPLDGTKAFGRRASTGVGTMLALVRDSKVIAAYVGDVNTREIFGYRPDSEKTHWITETGFAEPLEPRVGVPLSSQNVVLRDPLAEYSAAMQDYLMPGALFKSHEIGTGSIGIMFSRLWRGEVGGIALPPSHETPWDRAPIIGISERLGFIFCQFDDAKLVAVPQAPRKTTYKRDEELLVIHQSNLP